MTELVQDSMISTSLSVARILPAHVSAIGLEHS